MECLGLLSSSNQQLDLCDFDGAILDGTSLVEASLDRAILDRAILVGAILDGASLDGARLYDVRGTPKDASSDILKRIKKAQRTKRR